MLRQAKLILFAMTSFLAVPFLIVPCMLFVLALGVVSALGLIWGLLGLLVGNMLMAAESFGVGAATFAVIVVIWDRVFALRDALRRRFSELADEPIPVSRLRIDFDN